MPDAGVALSRTMAAQEIELEMIQRVDVGQALADAAGEGRVRVEELALIGDREERLARPPKLGIDAGKDGVGEGAIADQGGVAGGDGDVDLGEHHGEVAEERAEERPAAMHAAHELEAGFVLLPQIGVDGGAEAVPAGKQRPALRPPNTQGIARRSSMRSEALREAGRLPMLSSTISLIGVASRKYCGKRGVS
jgi:hypothetical protein